MVQSNLERMPLGEEGFNDLVKGRHGWFLYNRNDIYVGKSLEIYGEVSEDEPQLFSQFLKPGDIAIEAGSNIGTHTIPMAKMVGPTGKIFAFEPQRIVFQTLCANVALSSLINVDAVHAAVGDKNGNVVMPIFDYNKKYNYGGVSVDMTDKGESVQCIKLDKYLDLPKLKLIKMDIEGYEEKALQGAKKIIKKFKPIIYLENNRVEKSERLIKKLNSLGYKAFWHCPSLFNLENFARVKENIFSNTASFNMICVPTDTNMTIKNFQEATDPTQHPLKNK